MGCSDAALLSYGDQCSSPDACDVSKGLECHVAYKECGTTGVCMCKSADTHWQDGVCTKRGGIESNCSYNEQCMLGLYCDPDNDACDCPMNAGNTGYVASDLRECKLDTENMDGDGGSCHGSHAECFSNLECKENNCTCPEHTFPDGEDGSDYCRKHIINEACATTEDCIGSHVVCEAQSCQCASNYTALPKSIDIGCKKSGSVALLGVCEGDTQAGHDSCSGEAVCKKCGVGPNQCLTDGPPVDLSASKLEALLSYGDQCSSPDACDVSKGLECHVAYKECGTTGVCMCKDVDTHWIASVKECNKRKTFESNCNDDDECMLGLECEPFNDVCDCPTGQDLEYVASNWKDCQLDTENMDGGSCNDNDDQCFSNLQCKENNCTCPEHTFPDGEDGTDYCRKHKLNEACESTEDCKGYHVVCEAKKCQCAQNYTAFPERMGILGCKESGSVELLGVCEGDTQAGHDSCSGEAVCKKCGVGPNQCLTDGTIEVGEETTPGDSGSGSGSGSVELSGACALTMAVIINVLFGSY
ncbi:hypothetical protein ScPMuIL_014557 [Solemya velum]